MEIGDVNYNAIAMAAGVMAVVGLFWYQPVKDYIGGLKMRQKRRGEIQQIVLSSLVEYVEDCVADNLLTRDEATREVYEPLKRVFNTHKDLYPSETWLKERIDKRMKNGAHSKTGRVKNLLGR